ncbi:protein kinase kinase kinase [Perkinsus olseni]|uniref:Protein kinase kinase kinase n=1 Tax=Perkinsus olseni TaxID=32597 RepID=A0A7J6MBJ8_PEROL|nr:protein kinase kinase kinase [Perkinsus olseni]KAF4672073.1 protein kinase kinase kinase [Perkinsus olseni]
MYLGAESRGRHGMHASASLEQSQWETGEEEGVDAASQNGRLGGRLDRASPGHRVIDTPTSSRAEETRNNTHLPVVDSRAPTWELGELEQELRSVSKALTQTSNSKRRTELSKQLKRLKTQCQETALKEQQQTTGPEKRGRESLFAGTAGLIEEEMRSQYALLATTEDEEAKAEINAKIGELKEEFLKSMGTIRKISTAPRQRPVETVKSTKPQGKDALEALLRAVAAGNIKEVRALVEDSQLSVGVDSRDASGWSALHHASLIGWTEVASCLIEMKADVNAVNDLGGTPLHSAVEMENYDMVIPQGCLPMCSKGQIQLLLDCRADPLIEDVMCCHAFAHASPDLIRAFRKRLPREILPTEDDDDEPWEVDLADLEYGPMLGSGAAADVFRGTWREADVAIKNITWAKARETEEKVAEFKRELDILVNLRHPNLMLFMGAFTKSRPLRLVTELCDGGALSSILYNGPDIEMTWQQKRKICFDTAKGIYYLHTNHPLIIHRDLKSQNLLLAHPFKGPMSVPIVKIADFGIALMKHGPDSAQGSSGTQDAGGTWAWMAPEVLSEDRCDHQVDIYSFAICMYEIITRSRPYSDQPNLSPIAIAINVSTGMRPDLGLVPEDCPSLLRELMIDCWHGEPSVRPIAEKVVMIVGLAEAAAVDGCLIVWQQQELCADDVSGEETSMNRLYKHMDGSEVAFTCLVCGIAMWVQWIVYEILKMNKFCRQLYSPMLAFDQLIRSNRYCQHLWHPKEIERNSMLQPGDHPPKIWPFPTILHSWFTLRKYDLLPWIGPDAFMVLRYCQTCFLFCCWAAVLSFATLIPMYWSGENDSLVYGVNLLSFSNLDRSSQWFWSPVAAAYILSALFLFLLSREYRLFAHVRSAWVTSMPGKDWQQRRTIMVERIPPRYRSRRAVRQFFAEILGEDAVQACAFCHDVSGLRAKTRLRSVLSKCQSGPRVLMPNSARKTLKRHVEDLDEKICTLRRALWNGNSASLESPQRTPRVTKMMMPSFPDTVNNSTADSEEGGDASDGSLCDERPFIPVAADSDPDGDDSVDADSLWTGTSSPRARHHRHSNSRLPPSSFSEPHYYRGPPPTTLLHDFSASTSEGGHGDNSPHSDIPHTKDCTAFVTFRTMRLKQMALQLRLSDTADEWAVSSAPSPTDIIWPNITFPAQQAIKRQRITKALYWIWALGYALPLVAIQSLALPWACSSDEEGGFEIWTKLAALYVPTILQLLLVVALPRIFRWVCVNYERQKTRSAVTVSVLRRIFLFQLLTVYVIVIGEVWLSFPGIFHMAGTTLENALRSMGQDIASVGIYLVTMLVAKIGFGLGWTLLRGGDLIVMLWRKYRHPEEDPPLSHVPYAIELVDMCFAFLICASYMVISPLILIPGIIYFGTALVIYTYQFTYMHAHKYETGGNIWLRLFQCSIVSVCSSHVALAAVFVAQGSPKLAFLLVPLAIGTYAYGQLLISRHHSPNQDMSIAAAIRVDHTCAALEETLSQKTPFDAEMYVHPVVQTPLPSRQHSRAVDRPPPA